MLCCSPSRWRSGRAASARCSSAAFRKASSRNRRWARRSSQTTAAGSWRRHRASGCGCARMRSPASGTCSTRASRARASASSSATEAPTRRETSRSARRSSPTCRAAGRGLGRAPPQPAARRRRLAGRSGADRPRARPGTVGGGFGAVRPVRGRRRCAEPTSRRARARANPPCRAALAGRTRVLRRLSGQWLVERELRPASFEPDPDPITRGNYMHDVLERLLRRLGDRGSRRPAWGMPRASSTRSWLRSLAAVASGSSETVRDATLTTIRADLRRYLEQEAIIGLRLGPGGPRAPLRVRGGRLASALELEEVKLRGMIDRVDSNGAGQAIIRDYKTGSDHPSHRGDRWSEDRQPAGGAVHDRGP